MKLLSFILVVLMLVMVLPVHAASAQTDFESVAPGTMAEAIDVDGFSFAGTGINGWSIADVGSNFETIQNHSLSSCAYTTSEMPDLPVLTISFDTPQKMIQFDAGIGPIPFSLPMNIIRNGVIVDTVSYPLDVPNGGIFPQGTITYQAQQPFDAVEILNTSNTMCLYIDNLMVASNVHQLNIPAQIYQVSVSAPGVILYDAPDGNVVRDASGSEMRVPNPHTNSGQGVYNVVTSEEIDGQLWLQIFVGSSDLPWIPVTANVTILN